jgi:hypothetical protein
MAKDIYTATRLANRISKKGPRLLDFLTVGGSDTHGDD